MKVLVVNNHYFNYRGPDRYLFNLIEMLEKAGHEVIPFSFLYDATEENPYLDYFPEPVTGHGAFLLQDIKLTPAAKAKTALRMFRYPASEEKLRALIRATQPDIVYSIYLSFTLHPRLLRIAKEEFGLPVLYRLSDYHMFCASYLFFRDQRACTDCLARPWSAIRYKCVHDSYSASALRTAQILLNRLGNYYASVDYFICPSNFMKSTLARHGRFPENKLVALPTFTRDLFHHDHVPPAGRYGLYFGAVVPSKGVEVLLRAFNRITSPLFTLKLVGDVTAGYRDFLYALLDERHRAAVSIDGEVQGEALWAVLRNAAFVIHPVLWFENMPNSVIEAMSAAKPAIASDIGSMPELVVDGITGALVPPGDEAALAAALVRAMDPVWLKRMGDGARARYLENHSPQGHLRRLSGLMESLMASRPAESA